MNEVKKINDDRIFLESVFFFISQSSNDNWIKMMSEKMFSETVR